MLCEYKRLRPNQASYSHCSIKITQRISTGQLLYRWFHFIFTKKSRAQNNSRIARIALKTSAIERSRFFTSKLYRVVTFKEWRYFKIR